jgi:uncharacterized protein YeaO (DUF488 family)
MGVMIKVKHLMDERESDDGHRLYVEPVALTKDMTEWCSVEYGLSHLGPPMKLWEWFEEHPDGYEFFRARYHEFLAAGPYKDVLQRLACLAMRENFTLLHTGDDACHNTAAALHEFLSELEAYCPPE